MQKSVPLNETTSTHNSTQRSIIPQKTNFDFNLLLFQYLHFISFSTKSKRKLEWWDVLL